MGQAAVIDLDRLLDALKIQTKRQGARLWAQCPNPDHDDHDPSWFVWNKPDDPDKHGRHRCFGCGFGGGPLALVVAVFGCEWREAKAWLKAGDLDVPILALELEVRPTRRRTFKIPEGVRFTPIDRWPTPFRRYALGRGIGSEEVEKWSIGYAVDGDLRGRLVVPVREPDGVVRSYQARTILPGQTKYLTPTGIRSGSILGVEFWPEDHHERKRVVVIEGPIDAIAVRRATGLPVGALLGSEPNPSQLARLATFDQVDVLTDADAAGDKAARALEGLGRWVKLRRLVLPRGKDAASAGDATLRGLLHYPG